MEINRYIDFTCLKPEATLGDIKELCAMAIECEYFSVCVNPCFVKDAKAWLKGSAVKVAAVIGFPLGANTTEIKAAEAKRCVIDGADEIDMVANIGRIKERDFDYVVGEINAVRAAGALTKVIIETCLLNNDEKIFAAESVAASDAEYIKTSTGFSAGGASIDDVRLLKSIVAKSGKRVKAAGGIRTKEAAEAMIAAGADRIGVSKIL